MWVRVLGSLSLVLLLSSRISARLEDDLGSELEPPPLSSLLLFFVPGARSRRPADLFGIVMETRGSGSSSAKQEELAEEQQAIAPDSSGFSLLSNVCWTRSMSGRALAAPRKNSLSSILSVLKLSGVKSKEADIWQSHECSIWKGDPRRVSLCRTRDSGLPRRKIPDIRSKVIFVTFQRKRRNGSHTRTQMNRRHAIACKRTDILSPLGIFVPPRSK